MKFHITILVILYTVAIIFTGWVVMEGYDY